MPAGSFVPTTTPTSSFGRYPIRVRTLAPVAYWRLGERSGTSAADSFGTNTGTYVASPTLNVTGLLTSDSDAAATLTATSFSSGSYVSIPHASAIDLGAGPLTYAMWFNWTGGGFNCLIGKGTNSLQVWVNGNGKLALSKCNVNDICTATSTLNVATHFLVVTYQDPGTAKIILDNVDISGAVTPFACTSTAIALAIGSKTGASADQTFTGTVDEVAVWNRILSAAEISALYTDGTYTAVRHITVRIANKDVTPYVVADTFELEDASGDGAQGTFRCTINRALSLLPELFADAWVEVFDHDTGSDIFRGFLKTYRPVLSQGSTLRQTEIVATDHGELMDRFVPGPVRRPVEGDRARIAHFWHYYGASHRLNHHLTYVQSIDTSQEAATFTGTTLRRVFDAIAAQAGTTVRWYLDQVGRLHYYSTESNPAPRNVTSDTPGTGEISVEDLEIDYEAGAYANRVWVNGANAAATGYVQDDAAIHKIGTLMTASDPIDAPHATTAAARNKIGNAYLARVTAGISRGSFSVTSNKATGWLAGQTLTVRSSSIGINSSTRIVKVTTTMLKNDVRHYAIEFGSIRKPRGR